MKRQIKVNTLSLWRERYESSGVTMYQVMQLGSGQELCGSMSNISQESMRWKGNLKEKLQTRRHIWS